MRIDVLMYELDRYGEGVRLRHGVAGLDKIHCFRGCVAICHGRLPFVLEPGDCRVIEHDA